MDIILKYSALRPPASAGTPTIALASNSDFQTRLAQAAGGDQPIEQVTAIVQDFADHQFVSSAGQVAHGDRLIALLNRLRNDQLSVAHLPEALREILHDTSPDALNADLARVRDSVVTSYLLPKAPKAEIASDLVRVLTLAQAVYGAQPSRDKVDAIVRGPIALPGFVADLRAAPSAPATARPSIPELVKQINALAEQRRTLADTLEDVKLHAEDELLLSELGKEQPLAGLYRTTPAASEQVTGQKFCSTCGRPLNNLGACPEHGKAGNVGSRELAAATDKRPTQGLSDAQPVSPLLRAAVRRNVRLSAKAVELLPARSADALRSLKLDPATTPVSELRTQLTLQHKQTGQQLLDLSGTLARFNDATTLNTNPILVLDPSWRLDPVDAPEVPPAVNAIPPVTHTAVKPLGVADLLLVRAHIARYERSEVASIENILAHDTLTHVTRHLETSETTTTSDQESTDLRTQTQSTAENDNGHTTVQAVGPGVGPLAAEGASSFAQSVTDEVSSSSTQRNRQLATQRLLRESEDTLTHVVDNSKSETVSYGVYQWLDKVYLAQIFTYGSRLLYDLVVPEPAALFREAMSRQRSGVALPVKPAKFTLNPTYLTADNWAYYVTGHHATGVDAPPSAEIVVTEPFGGMCKDEFSTDAATCTLHISETRSTRIPRGYRAKSFRVTIEGTSYPNGVLQAVIGSKHFTINNPNGFFVAPGALDGETETLPVGISVHADGVNYGVQAISVGVEIICEPTPEFFAAWQVKTHGIIFSANQQRFQEYEEAIANRDATARLFLQGLTPDRKLSIVKTEMKRATLELLTAQSFAGFNATKNDGMGFPFPDPAATSGLAAYIRFFEQAVEWEHLAYAFYPYFWGSQASWVSKLVNSETDTQFAGFLTCGAARVVLPIRRGYEAAFEHFVTTGLTPTTDELLDVGSSLWVSLVDELRNRQVDDWTEQAVDEPWEFRVASNLVRARPDGSMPKWTLSAGKWSDAADPAF